MGSNIPKPNRGARIAALQKLVDGFTAHAERIPRLTIGGRTMTPQELIDELNVLIAIAGHVEIMWEAWCHAVRGDLELRRSSRAFLSSLRKAVLAAFTGRDDRLADYGLASRERRFFTREQLEVAAAKAKVTRMRNHGADPRS